MTCAEFQRELPDFLEKSGSAEFEAHVKSCANCSGLAETLQAIASEARMLQASAEPSPRVWNSLEIQLRKEGLIHEPRRNGQRSILPSLTRRWGVLAYLVPAAAALLVGATLFLYRPNMGKVADNSPMTTPASDISDEQVLQEVGARAPMMRATYESNLRDANAYIQDAKASVDADPTDEEAQQALLDAYGQKSMIYQMALDRSLP